MTSEYFDNWSALSQTVIFLIEHAWILKNNEFAGTWPLTSHQINHFLGHPVLYEKIKQGVAKQRHQCKPAFVCTNIGKRRCIFSPQITAFKDVCLILMIWNIELRLSLSVSAPSALELRSGWYIRASMPPFQSFNYTSHYSYYWTKAKWFQGKHFNLPEGWW